MRQKGSITAIILIILALAAAGAAGYFGKDVIKQISDADKRTGGMENLNEKEIFSGKTTTPTPAPKKETVTYNNSNPKYSLERKVDWSESTSTSRSGFINPLFTSPTYKMEEPENGYAFVKTGVQISIAAENATKSTVSEEFDNRMIYKEAGQNKKNLTVAGVDAIQFDFSYEAALSVTTLFIKNNILYTVDMRYSYEEGKDKFFTDYENLIKSIKFI
jgi:hypothetical protein